MCPGCGATEAHIDAEGLAAEAKQGAWGMFLVFFRCILAVLMLLAASIFDVGAFWSAVIAWAAIGLLALVVFRWISSRNKRRWLEGRQAAKAHEMRYARFLNEHPALRSALPKERHEAFRKWLAHNNRQRTINGQTR